MSVGDGGWRPEFCPGVGGHAIAERVGSGSEAVVGQWPVDGGTGGVGGAVSAELYQWMTEESTLQKIQGLAELDPGQEPTAEQQEMFAEWRQNGGDVGRLVGAASAALIATSGNEVYIGADAGQSVAEDNILPAVILLVQGAMIAWTAYGDYGE